MIVDLAGVGANLVDHPFGSLDIPIAAPTLHEPKFQVGVSFHSTLEASSSGAPALQIFLGGPWPVDADLILGSIAFLAEGLRMVRAVVRTRAFGRIASGEEVAPAPGIPDDDEARLVAAIRATVGTHHHPVGTCRMGPDPDRGDVVDSQGRVHGVGGLRVADASVMPDIPSVNTNLPTIMVAERIASFMAAG